MDITTYQHMRISTRGKRPLRNLTPGDKVRAIQRIHNGETKASVSRDIGVPESTLRGWCKNEQKLRFMCRQLGAAIADQGMSMNNIDNPPQKRQKVVEQFEFGHSFGYDRFGSFNSKNRLIAAGVNEDSEKNCFINNNVLADVLKKNCATKEETSRLILSDSAFLPGGNALSTAANCSRLSLNQNMNIFSFLNPSFTIFGANAGCKVDSMSVKTALSPSNVQMEVLNKSKKEPASVLIKSWAHESLYSPLDNSETTTKDAIDDAIDDNDSNNNDVRPRLSLPTSDLSHDLGVSRNFFPASMLLPPIQSLSNETRSDVLLQWSKVFNASLGFLALATAVAAIQYPTSALSLIDSSIETKSLICSEYTPPIFDHSEDSNCESEPEDLSIRSGTSKVSSSANSRPQSVTLSGEEH